MAIPPALQNLINQLNQEFAQTEQEATQGLNLVRELLSRFPDNAVLIQFFARFNNVVLFVEIYKRQTQDVVDLLTATDVAAEDIQEAGEDLSSILGQVLETKIELMSTIARLQSLQ